MNVASDIVSAFATVYAAYAQVKSNKDRCGQLKDRCETIMARAQEMIEANDDEVVRERLKELERVFRKTADTIMVVGQQNWVTSLIKTMENAALISDTQQELTHLITLLNLNMVVDLYQWQKENEEANRKDFLRLVSMVKQLQQSTDTAHAELRKQGLTLDKLEEIARTYEPLLDSSSPSPPTSPSSTSSTSNKDLPNLPQHRGRSLSLPSGERPSINRILRRNGRPDITNNAVATSQQNQRPVFPQPQRSRARFAATRLGRGLGVATGSSSVQGPSEVTSPSATDLATAALAVSSPYGSHDSNNDSSRRTRTRTSSSSSNVPTAPPTRTLHAHSPHVQSPLSQYFVARSSSSITAASIQSDEKSIATSSATDSFNLNLDRLPPPSSAGAAPPPSSAAFTDAPPPTGASIASVLSDSYNSSVFDDDDDDAIPEHPPPPYSAMAHEEEIAEWARRTRPQMSRIQTQAPNPRTYARGGYNNLSLEDLIAGRNVNVRGSANQRQRAYPSVDSASVEDQERPPLNRGSDSTASLTPIPPMSPSLSVDPSVVSYMGPDPPRVDLPLMDPVERVRKLLKIKEANNFGALKTIGNFGTYDMRVLMEMWLLPKKARSYKSAIPLSAFHASSRDKLQVVSPRGVEPTCLANTVPVNDVLQLQYNEVILLCPPHDRPTVVVTKTGRKMPQQAVKSYIYYDCDPMTLVAVNELDRISWFLIPYGPYMTVLDAKRCILDYFGDAYIETCTMPGRTKPLIDQSTFFDNGVKANNHCLSMRVRLFAA